MICIPLGFGLLADASWSARYGGTSYVEAARYGFQNGEAPTWSEAVK